MIRRRTWLLLPGSYSCAGSGLSLKEQPLLDGTRGSPGLVFWWAQARLPREGESKQPRPQSALFLLLQHLGVGSVPCLWM